MAARESFIGQNFANFQKIYRILLHSTVHYRQLWHKILNFLKISISGFKFAKNHHQALNPILKDLVSQQHHQAEYEKGPNVKILNYKITSVGLN